MKKSSQGLPNVGNTCFLNTVLQGLFSVEQFRSQILTQRQRQGQQLSMSCYLKKIFLAIKQQTNEEKKRVILKSFQQFLVKKMGDYSGFTQQDASFFLLQIINKLIEQNQGYRKYFLFDCLSKCQNYCIESNYILQNQICFSGEQALCPNPRCVQKKMLKFLNGIPEAILVTDLKSIKQEMQFDVIPNWDSFSQKLRQQILLSSIEKKNELTSKYCSKIKYSLRSVILYRGNKKSGHYINLRALDQSQNKYKLINDLNVSEQKQLKEHNLSNFTPLIFIYQKKNVDMKSKGKSSQNQIDKPERQTVSRQSFFSKLWKLISGLCS